MQFQINFSKLDSVMEEFVLNLYERITSQKMDFNSIDENLVDSKGVNEEISYEKLKDLNKKNKISQVSNNDKEERISLKNIKLDTKAIKEAIENAKKGVKTDNIINQQEVNLDEYFVNTINI